MKSFVGDGVAIPEVESGTPSQEPDRTPRRWVARYRGLLDLVSLLPRTAPSRPTHSRSMFVKEQWIARGMENLLWLPSDYRPTSTAVRGSIVVLGHASGRVSILEFAL